VSAPARVFVSPRLLACGVLAAALALQPAGARAAGSGRTVTDDLGHAVRIAQPPLRIVSLSPGATEMLFSAGAGGELIATVEYSDEPPAARTVPRIGDSAAIDLERVVALRPDAVVASPALGNPAQRDKLDVLGIPVYDQQVVRLADLPASLRRLGALAGTQAAADHAASALESRLETLRRTYSGTGSARRPTVLLQVWNRPIYTIGGRHLMSDALALCGVRNVFADLTEPSPLVDIEAVIARNPDIILVAAPPGEGAAWAADWKRYSGLAAVQAGRVVTFEDQALSRLGPSIVGATENLCRTLARVSPGSY
jgi:iron complex transport system substrate-binding protein